MAAPPESSFVLSGAWPSAQYQIQIERKHEPKPGSGRKEIPRVVSGPRLCCLDLRSLGFPGADLWQSCESSSRTSWSWTSPFRAR